MFTINFLVDEEELSEDLEMNIPSEDDDLFVLSYFMMSVSIFINNIDVFNPPCTWINLPISRLCTTVSSEMKGRKGGKRHIFTLHLKPDSCTSMRHL